MDNGTPAEHPDHDLLADLAAQTVLSADLADRVEAHVRGCASCAGLLAEAEAIQAMLRTLPPEPMPADVSSRIEQALAAEFAATRTAGLRSGTLTGPLTGPLPETHLVTGTGELPTRRSLRTGQLPITQHAPSTPSAAGDPSAASDPGAPGEGTSGPRTGSLRTPGPPTGRIRIGGERPAQVSRLRRMSTSRQSSRRQALDEQRSDRPSRVVPVLRVAAGLAAILVVGTGAYQVLTRVQASPSADMASGASEAAGGAPILAPVLSTGTNYTKATLATQVKSLVGQSQGQAAYAARSDTGADEATRGISPAEASRSVLPNRTARSEPPQTLSSKQLTASGDLLRSTPALRACLTAIGEPDAQPVAVDLARYGGRDAAILVIPAANGDYNVWVVARDCAPNKDGTLDYAVVPA
jgi:hypothetical protein